MKKFNFDVKVKDYWFKDKESTTYPIKICVLLDINGRLTLQEIDWIPEDETRKNT